MIYPTSSYGDSPYPAAAAADLVADAAATGDGTPHDGPGGATAVVGPDGQLYLITDSRGGGGQDGSTGSGADGPNGDSPVRDYGDGGSHGYGDAHGGGYGPGGASDPGAQTLVAGPDGQLYLTGGTAADTPSAPLGGDGRYRGGEPPPGTEQAMGPHPDGGDATLVEAPTIAGLPSPPFPEQDTVQKAAVRGQAFVEDRRGTEPGQLSPERASLLLADPDKLARIGTLLGDPAAPPDPTDPDGLRGLRGVRGVRAAEVYVGDVGTSAGAADLYLSQAADDGRLDPEQFTALANDGEFLGTLLGRLVPPEGAAPDTVGAERTMEQALGSLAAERPPTDGQGQAFVSKHGLMFAQVPADPDGGAPADPSVSPADAPTAARYVTRDGTLFPPELQARLDAAEATPEGIDPYTLRGAFALGGQGIELAPAERFTARSYEAGLIDTDTFLAQINDPAFLNDPSVARAAESLLGTSANHSKADDFVNDLYGNGHIDQAKFIEHANDFAFLQETDAAIASGSVTYTTENFGRADEMLGMSEEEIRAELAPGFDFGAGPPTDRQIVALYEAVGRSDPSGATDQKFIELAAAWVKDHNPGLEFRYGHRTQEAADAGAPREFFWTDGGRPIDDPFLNLLTGEFDNQQEDLDINDQRAADFASAKRNEDPNSVPLRIKFEGVSGATKDETSDRSRYLVGLAFPGRDIDEVLDNQGGLGIDVDDNFVGGQDRYTGGIDGKAREALAIVNPELFGTQITQADGVDGLQVVNSTRFDDTAVAAQNTSGLSVDTSANAGDLTLEIADSTDPTISAGSGSDTIVVSDGPVIDGHAYRDAVPAPEPGSVPPAPSGGDPAAVEAGGEVPGDGVPIEQLDAMVVDALTTGMFVDAQGYFVESAFVQGLDATMLTEADKSYVYQAVMGSLAPPVEGGVVG